jgi:uncharacterized protein YjbJ (UPF0337 family)
VALQRTVKWPEQGSHRKTKGSAMTDQSKDRMSGAFDEAKGKGKEALGGLKDDKNTEMQGKKDQAMGKAKQGMADAKDKADDVVKNITNRDNG